ncbi:MAG: hypothetical protein WBB62_05315 [Rhodococcus sp. (in: high G+C Gram-positive bacteria)]|jgi:hypothetical protein
MTTADSARPGVSPATEQKLRDAMQRLLGGQAKHTDGRLTKNNLCAEAGVSRATMNRAVTVMTEWDGAVTGKQPRDPRFAQLEAEISRLKHLVTDLRAKNSDLKQRNQAAVTVIAELNAQLLTCRGQEPAGTVTPIDRQRRSRSIGPCN